MPKDQFRHWFSENFTLYPEVFCVVWQNSIDCTVPQPGERGWESKPEVGRAVLSVGHIFYDVDSNWVGINNTKLYIN